MLCWGLGIDCVVLEECGGKVYLKLLEQKIKVLISPFFVVVRSTSSQGLNFDASSRKWSSSWSIPSEELHFDDE
ncbi:hypothetical protein RHMOL_Rhmol05G0246900 [Rhododendron molle]|uniref:Uncharacterized protein n=1 Tax=Rhododendron molle TaxID=49168 RepID=A0ACC0NSX5_RHOML|nr:hypothetical protein RHMOL_Rhmol05G0246900 [Rhododendron molle]